MKQTVYFRVDADHGKDSGFGHLKRTLRIYHSIKKNFNKRFNYIFLSKNYKIGINYLKKNSNDKIILYSKQKLKKIQFNSNDIFLIDTLGAEEELISKLKQCGVSKVISFDEINTNIFNEGIIINGIFFAKKKVFPKKKLQVFQGEKFILLNEKYKKKSFFGNHKKKKVLITSGGSDYKNFLFKMTNLFLELGNFKIDIIIGPGVNKSNKIFKIKNQNVKLKTGIKNLYSIIQKSDVCVCTGGTVMFEAISTGKLPIIIENYEHQKYAIKYFDKKKSIINAGQFQNVNKQKINLLINKYYKMNQKKYFKHNCKVIDGRGLERIEKILINLMQR